MMRKLSPPKMQTIFPKMKCRHFSLLAVVVIRDCTFLSLRAHSESEIIKSSLRNNVDKWEGGCALFIIPLKGEGKARCGRITFFGALTEAFFPIREESFINE